jgi:hypothetical protein
MIQIATGQLLGYMRQAVSAYTGRAFWSVCGVITFMPANTAGMMEVGDD